MLKPVGGPSAKDMANASASTHAEKTAPPLSPPKEDAAAKPAVDKPIRFHVDPNDPQRLVIPPDKPVKSDKLTKSRMVRNVLGGTFFGATTGAYVAVTALPSQPLACMLVIAGCTVGGAAAGYFLTQ